ncbi:MAG: 2-pyrone-4,6-dicarboxylate hydrolase [Acidobacteria bacterium]|nr:2-pyrone-4,6-dicarboxylate hydrolase [Acidobacteriota bacterium]
MGEHATSRRTFLKSAGLAALSAAGVAQSEAGRAQRVVPNSAGTDAPRLKAPANACDCHHHIYDVRFPQPRDATTRLQASSRVEDYQRLQGRIGTTRDVVVTPSAYLTDNRVTLDAIAKLGPNARGVAVIGAGITAAELKRLDDGGIRGIRFSLAVANGVSPTIPPATVNTIQSLATRVNALGWHLQFNVTADQIVAAADILNRLPAQLVFDHMGHMPQPMGIDHPAFTIVRRLVDKGRTWVKLSVTYDSSTVGPPTYADVNTVGRAYVQAAPERMVWGSNWPHPNEIDKPNDAALFDLLSDWAPREATRHRILVENPETLYGFTTLERRPNRRG